MPVSKLENDTVMGKW